MGERAHGTRARYVVDRCRCAPCTAANAVYARDVYRAKHRPDTEWRPLVDAGPARAHLAWLSSVGVGRHTVAQLTGLGDGVLCRLVYGRGGHPPSRRVRPASEAAILAVRPEDASGAQILPGGPTWRRLDELLAAGWTKASLARRLGLATPALQIRRERVLASTARKVRELHRELTS